jgi:hypothetical protein
MKPLWLVVLLSLGVLALPSTASATTGKLQICKKAKRGSGITGTFTFAVTDSIGTHPVTVAVGGCSRPFIGHLVTTITEQLGPGVDVDKIAVVPAKRQVSQDRSLGQVVVKPTPKRTVVVTFTNDTVSGVLRLCKVLTPSSSALAGTSFQLNVIGADTNAPGARGNLGSVTVTPPVAGVEGERCHLLGPSDANPLRLPVGSHISVTETPVSGAQITSIVVDPASQDDGSTATTAKLVIGAGTTTATFTNQAVGSIKVCKTLPNDAGYVPHPTFAFTVDGGAPFELQAIAGQTVCTEALVVAVGDHTVEETGIPAGFEFVSVSTDPAGALQTGSTDNPATVSVGLNGQSKVTFANQIKRAKVKVCKSAADGSGLLGDDFHFTATDLGLPATFTLTPTADNRNLDCTTGSAVPVLQNDGSATSGTIAETNSGVTASIAVTGGGSGNTASGTSVTVTLDTTGTDATVTFTNRPVAAPGSFRCPPDDQLGFAVAVKDETTDPIFCSYPAVEGEDPFDFYCTYSYTTGALVEDHDAGLCQPNAVNVSTSAALTAVRDGARVNGRPPKPRPAKPVGAWWRSPLRW